MFPEFYDEDFLVFMLPISKDALMNLAEVLFSIPKKAPISVSAPVFSMPKKAMTICEALFSPFEEIEVKGALHRVLSAPTVSCPPAIPIVVSGELITQNVVDLLKFYNYEKINIIKSPAT